MEHCFKPFIILKKLQGAWAKNIYLKLALNGRVLGEEADLKAESFSLALMPIESTNVEVSTKTAFLPNTCYTQAIY